MKFILVCVIALLSLSANEAVKPAFFLKPDGTCVPSKLNKGKQIPGGFCSDTIQGVVPASTSMTSTLIVSPQNEALLPAGQTFTVDVSIKHLQTGFFSDPDTQYYSKPQTLNGHGDIIGHSHVTIQKLDDNHASPPDARTFAFFKGLNDAAKDGHLTVDVNGQDGPGLPVGRYRVCTMASTFTHQPLLMPIAKRGSQDDCIRINVAIIDHIDKKGKPKGKGKPKEKGKPKRKENQKR